MSKSKRGDIVVWFSGYFWGIGISFGSFIWTEVEHHTILTDYGGHTKRYGGEMKTIFATMIVFLTLAGQINADEPFCLVYGQMFEVTQVMPRKIVPATNVWVECQPVLPYLVDDSLNVTIHQRIYETKTDSLGLWRIELLPGEYYFEFYMFFRPKNIYTCRATVPNKKSWAFKEEK